ncbi:MAG: RsmE family RNA methyltransferase [Thermoanaerobaculia bacterium]
MGLYLSRAYLIVSRLPRAGERILLPREEVSHARARRLSPGDAVVLLDGSGAAGEGVLVRLDARGAEVEVGRIHPKARSVPEISVFVAGVRAERLAWIAEKVTELSATRLVILRTERTQTFRAAALVLPRLERIVREAAKQCGGPRWPEVSGPVSLAEVLSRERASHIFLCDREGACFPSRLTAAPMALLVGPEGGWSDEERRAAREAGAITVAIPAGRLRTETAAVAALVLARAALGRET